MFAFTVSGEDADVNSPSSTASIKLMTYLRYGEISYKSGDVLTWDNTWRPPKSLEETLKKEWEKHRLMKLTIFVDENGRVKKRDVSSPSLGDYCSIS